MLSRSSQLLRGHSGIRFPRAPAEQSGFQKVFFFSKVFILFYSRSRVGVVVSLVGLEKSETSRMKEIGSLLDLSFLCVCLCLPLLSSDLWALGCIIFQLQAGRPPFHAP